MEIVMINKTTKWFPCPLCLKPLDVRMTKRKKPYVICSPCGVQMFVRERVGIETFSKLVEQGLKSDVFTRVGQLEQRYRLKCPVCKKLTRALAGRSRPRRKNQALLKSILNRLRML